MRFDLCVLVSKPVADPGELVGFEDTFAEHFLLLHRHQLDGLELLTHRTYRVVPEEDGSDELSDKPALLASVITF